jgi:hypothetical protein
MAGDSFAPLKQANVYLAALNQPMGDLQDGAGRTLLDRGQLNFD